MGRPFRFGLQASTVPDDGAAWAALARKVEDLGYSVLTVADHLDDQVAWVPALMAAADATTSLRVGALVACNDYRLPIVLAKEAATIDLLSGGRLELGVGAGWMTTDYEQAGIPLDRPGVRIARLAEALDVIERQWADAQPTPVQSPRPPLLLGGGGRRMLELAARRADIVGINVSLHTGVIDAEAGKNGTVAATDEKVAWIRAAAGDRLDDIELQVRVHVAAVTDDRVALAELLAPALGVAPEAALASPHALAGTVDEICDDLEARRERWGISYIGVSLDALEAFAPVVGRLAGR